MKWGETVAKFILKRLAYIFVSIFVISLITFVLVKHTPGNYLETQQIMEQSFVDSSMSPTMVELWKKTYDLDKPEWYQYLKFTVNAFRFQFGPSFKYPTMKTENLIKQAFPVSLSLALISISLALAIGIPIGILAAIKRDTIIDRVAVLISMIGSSIPNYVMAVFLSYFLALKLHLVPTIGWGKPQNYVLPVLALSIGPIGSITRYVRSTLIDTLGKE
jgi:peptide/nickel transport system permease protein